MKKAEDRDQQEGSGGGKEEKKKVPTLRKTKKRRSLLGEDAPPRGGKAAGGGKIDAEGEEFGPLVRGEGVGGGELSRRGSVEVRSTKLSDFGGGLGSVGGLYLRRLEPSESESPRSRLHLPSSLGLRFEHTTDFGFLPSISAVTPLADDSTSTSSSNTTLKKRGSASSLKARESTSSSFRLRPAQLRRNAMSN